MIDPYAVVVMVVACAMALFTGLIGMTTVMWIDLAVASVAFLLGVCFAPRR